MKKIYEFFKQKDKQLHMFMCFVFALISPWLGLAAGLVKEGWDSAQPNNKWSWGDIIADVIGVLLAVGVKLFWLWLWR